MTAGFIPAARGQWLRACRIKPAGHRPPLQKPRSLGILWSLMKKDIHVAHSPDSDDAFMFYALATRKIDTGELNYMHTLSDIETLNRKAMKGEYEVSAILFHAYAYMSEKYALLSCGASMGQNYGPIVVSARPMRAKSLANNKVIAIPGTLTT